MSHDPECKSSELEARTRALFEQSVDDLDGRTRSRLNRARHAALEELRSARAQPWRRAAWIPVSGAAAATVLAVWMTLSPGNGGEGVESGMPIDDLDLFAESPSIDLLQDVEFYAWIATETPDVPNGNSG